MRPVGRLAAQAAGVSSSSNACAAGRTARSRPSCLAPLGAVADERRRPGVGAKNMWRPPTRTCGPGCGREVELAGRLRDLLEHEVGVEAHDLALDPLAGRAEQLERSSCRNSTPISEISRRQPPSIVAIASSDSSRSGGRASRTRAAGYLSGPGLGGRDRGYPAAVRTNDRGDRMLELTTGPQKSSATWSSRPTCPRAAACASSWGRRRRTALRRASCSRWSRAGGRGRGDRREARPTCTSIRGRHGSSTTRRWTPTSRAAR